MPTVPFLGGYGDTSGAGLMFRNKLINGNFNIWQRGTSFSSVATYTYTADRWLTDGAVTSVTRSGTQSNVLTVVTQAGTGIAQRIETNGGNFFAGQTYTLSALVNCTNADLTAIVTYRDSNTFKSTIANVNLSSQVTAGQYVKVSTTFTLADSPTAFANTNCIQVSFISTAVNTINFQNVQFEAGSVATPFEQRPIGTEFALCQRYYHVMSYDASQNSTNIFGSGCIDSATVGTVFLGQFPVRMRIAPAAALVGTFKVFGANGANSASDLSLNTAIQQNRTSPTQASLYISFSGGYVGGGMVLYSNTANSGITFSAEL